MQGQLSPSWPGLTAHTRLCDGQDVDAGDKAGHDEQR